MRKQLQQLMLVSFIIIAVFQLFSVVTAFTGGEHVSAASFMLHTVIFALAILYIVFLQQQLRQLKADLAIMGQLWQRLPFIVNVLNSNCNERENEYIKMLKILVNMFEMKDLFSKGHSQVVCDLAQELGKRLGMPDEEIKVLVKAAIFHDIGKIIIPASILNKTEALTDEDYSTIRRHSTVGADIVEAMSVFKDAGPIIRHHHERYDGKGYPDGLIGQEIPLGARIIAVVDAFDAMTVGRTYSGKKDVETAVALIKQEEGKQFDPEIVQAFVEMVYAGRTNYTVK